MAQPWLGEQASRPRPRLAFRLLHLSDEKEMHNRAESRLDEAEEDLRNAVLLQMKVFGLLHLLPK